MVATPESNPRYALKYVGNASQKAAVFANMHDDGQHVHAKEHMLPLLMPDVYKDAAGNTATELHTSHLDLLGLVLPGALLDAELKTKGCHLMCCRPYVLQSTIILVT